MPRVRFDRELRNLQEALRIVRCDDRVDLLGFFAARARDVHRALEEHLPAIVHFSGHGTEYGEILLDSDDGDFPQAVSTEALGHLFSLYVNSVECVILNACFTSSMLSELVRHIPFAVGMRDDVEDGAAIAFAEGFYEALARSREVTVAFQHGSVRMSLAGYDGAHKPILLSQGGLSRKGLKQQPREPEESTGDLLLPLDYARLEKLSRPQVHALVQRIKVSLLKNEDRGDLRLSLGLALLDTGDFDGALASFKRAARLAPAEAAIHCYVALSELRGRVPRQGTEEALRALEGHLGLASELGGCAELVDMIRLVYVDAGVLVPPPGWSREVVGQRILGSAFLQAEARRIVRVIPEAKIQRWAIDLDIG